jgi:ankyrin repeat protein
LLKEQGANIRGKDNNSQTSLYFTAEGRQLEVVKWLKEQGADIHEKDNDDCTALHLAAQNEQLEVVKWLKGPDVSRP